MKKIREAKRILLQQAWEASGNQDFKARPVGRPRIEGLAAAILKIANSEGAADPRRRSEMVGVDRTLTNLNDKLKSLGCKVGRTATYYRLMPVSGNTHAA